MVKIEPLDSESMSEDITIIIGRNILLKLLEKDESKQLLSDKLVKKFLSVKDFCNDSVSSLIEELFTSEITPSSYIKNLLESISNLSRSAWDESLKKLDNIQLNSNQLSHFSLSSGATFFHSTETPGIDRIQSQDKRLVSVNDTIKEKLGLNLLVPSIVLLCPHCQAELTEDALEKDNKCPFCRKTLSSTEVKQVNIHKIDEKIRSVWRSNLYFEAYMSRLLRTLNWKTWTNVLVMGSSGILHEIDFLGIKAGTMLIGECKSGKVSRNDVFNFCTKANDVKAHISILALLNELPEPETREFLSKNRGIVTLENIRKNTESQLLEELSRRL